MSPLGACLLSVTGLVLMASAAVRGEAGAATARPDTVHGLLDTSHGPTFRQGRQRPRGELGEAAVAVRYLRRLDGWSVAETENFRILHNQKRELVQKVAQVAERTRLAMHRKWFGDTPDDWLPRCKIYLHATHLGYELETGVKDTLGHALIRLDGRQVDSRSIHVYCTAPNLVQDVVPHEVTHAVLAGHFGKHDVPRWADEGMALLSQPRDSIDEFTRVLPKHREDGDLFALEVLMTTEESALTNTVEFYAQSVSVVDFLVAWKGPQEFTEFLWDSFHTDYGRALKQHYGVRGFADLDKRWQAYTFGEGPPTEGFALLRCGRRLAPARGN